MGSTPTIDQLKVDCNSNRTEHGFRYLFMQDEAEAEMFVTRLEGHYKDGLILSALNAVLQVAREATQEKHRHVITMEQYG